jgi:hypothetical protein
MNPRSELHSPPEHNYHHGYHRRRPSNLQTNQNNLLPYSERTQIDGSQTRPGGCADTNEEGVDVPDVKLPVGCPKDDRPEERDYDTEAQAKSVRDWVDLETGVCVLTKRAHAP